MPCGTVDIYSEGRRKLGTFLMGLAIAQAAIGICILGCAIYFLRNLHWRLSVVQNHNSYTLGVFVLMTGSVSIFIHLCAAKIFYDSGKDETRRRFEFLLFPTLVAFIVLVIFQFALLITCKVHRDYDLEHFQKGFVHGIGSYSSRSDIKMNMDRLQAEDQCCGAEHFMDWIEADWVSPGFNPMSDPNMDFREKSIFWPWSLLPPVALGPQSDEFSSYEQRNVKYEPSQPINNAAQNGEFRGAVDFVETSTFAPLHKRMPRRSKRSNAQLAEAIAKEKRRKNRPGSNTRMETYSERFPASENREHLSVVPWSCCSVDYFGPCVFDYVTQRNLARELGVREYWNGESLSQQGCAPLLQAKYRSYSQACLILFCLALIFQVILLVAGRYLQTCVENIDMYNREDKSAPGYLLPCSWFGGADYKSIAKHKVRPGKHYAAQETPDDDDDLEKGGTTVSLADEYDSLKRRKRRKYKKLKQLLLPKRKRPHAQELEKNDESDGSETGSLTAPKKSVETQALHDELELGDSKPLGGKRAMKADKMWPKSMLNMEENKRERKRQRLKPHEEDNQDTWWKMGKSQQRMLSPKNLYKKVKKKAQRFIDTRSTARI